MTEIIIAGIFLLFILLREKQHADEVRLLSKALIAKNVYEFNDSQIKDEKEKPIKEPLPILPSDQVSDEEFLAAIHKELEIESPQEKFKEKIKNKIWPKSTPQE